MDEKTHVKTRFTAVVADNVGYMRLALELVCTQFPFLFALGCCVHILDLLLEDVAGLAEIADVVMLCVELIKFIRGHKRVASMYLRIRTEQKVRVLPLDNALKPF